MNPVSDVKPIDANLPARARRMLLKMHYESGVGHLGGNLSCIDALLVTLHEFVGTEDRFILSKGHSAGALYVALATLGRIGEEELRTFHRDDTRLAGHPPAAALEDVRFATGSLGHGLSLAAGTAKALKMLGKQGHVYCLTSDGEWQEGSTWEALIFLSHQGLDNLTVLVDHNGLQGFGATSEIASMFPLWERIKGFAIDIIVVDGHDLRAIREALHARSERPKVVVLQTVKGKGVSFMQDRMEWHYLPMSQDQYQAALQDLQSE